MGREEWHLSWGILRVSCGPSMESQVLKRTILRISSSRPQSLAARMWKNTDVCLFSLTLWGESVEVYFFWQFFFLLALGGSWWLRGFCGFYGPDSWWLLVAPGGSGGSWWLLVSHVQNCRQLILVFGGIYSLKNWMASCAHKLFTSFAQTHVRASFAQTRNHVDNWNRNEWIYNEKGYTT